MNVLAIDPPVLEVENLVTHFPVRGGVVKAVDGVSFAIRRGRTTCIVGESGSGKSVTARSILQIVDRPGRIVSGAIRFRRGDETTDLAALDPRGKAIRAFRGSAISMIFQEPMSSLSPVHTIGDQVGEVLKIHRRMGKDEIRARVVDLLRAVEIPKPELAFDRYAFEFSGGMRQRAMIAMSLACDPDILIADEPTTALDVTTQAEILDLMRRLQRERGMAVLFITHDMGVVAEIADDVVVMRHGKIVEQGPVEAIFADPRHEYTRMLLSSVRKLEERAEIRARRAPIPETAAPVLVVTDLKMHFPIQKGFFRRTIDTVKAVDGVSFELKPGETLGVVGESGSGKTTLGRCMLRVFDPTAGRADFRMADGGVVDLVSADKGTVKRCRREIRMIFQDPFASLNPRMTVGQNIAEPMLVTGLAKGSELRDRVAALMRKVQLDPATQERYPHAFSGGQRQRIAIARAISLQPRVIVADEATAALDVSLRARMLDLLLELQDELGLAYVFVSHDIGVIRYMCDRVAVMYRGRMVEVGETEQVCTAPTHGYTKALISAVPRPDPAQRSIHLRHRYVEGAA
jgi:peptide/nickel transport system ATP-binding protein